MKRGDIVLVAAQGDYGKPRPAVIVQANSLARTDSILVSPITSVPLDVPLYRILVEPDDRNGLGAVYQVMVEKTLPMQRVKCSAPIGNLTADQIDRLDRKLALVLGLSDG